jgi:hypothetical protein
VKYAWSGFLTLIAVVLIFVSITAAETEIHREPLGPDNWPVTVEGAVDDLLPRLSLSEKLMVRFMKKEDTISLHLGLGMLIRNRYGLWRGNDKLILSACGFPCHPDDASVKIIEAVWQELHK